MSKNTGKEYEQFVEDIYRALTKDDRFTSIERDVMLEGKDGPRQIDVLLRSEVANLNLLTVIECRDYQSRLDVTHIDGFHSKLQDVNASKGVLVSRKGFSNTARQKSARLGITLCLASDASSVAKNLKIVIPIKVRHIILSGSVNFNFSSTIGGSSFDVNDLAKELEIFDILYEKLYISGDPTIIPSQSEIQDLSKEIKLPHPVYNSKGTKVANLTALKMNLKFGINYHYGHLSDIPNLVSMHQYDSNSTTFIIKAHDYPALLEVLPSMAKFRSEDKIPPNYRLTFNLIDFRFNQFRKNPIKNRQEEVVRFIHKKS